MATIIDASGRRGRSGPLRFPRSAAAWAIALLCGIFSPAAAAAGESGVSIAIETDQQQYSRGEEIAVQVRVEPRQPCVVFDPSITTSAYEFVVVDKQGLRVKPKIPSLHLEIPPCNFASFYNVGSIESEVVISAANGADSYGPYYELDPGTYCVTLQYKPSKLTTVMKLDTEDKYCWDRIYDQDFVPNTDSNEVCFEVIAED